MFPLPFPCNDQQGNPHNPNSPPFNHHPQFQQDQDVTMNDYSNDHTEHYNQPVYDRRPLAEPPYDHSSSSSSSNSQLQSHSQSNYLADESSNSNSYRASGPKLDCPSNHHSLFQTQPFQRIGGDGDSYRELNGPQSDSNAYSNQVPSFQGSEIDPRVRNQNHIPFFESSSSANFHSGFYRGLLQQHHNHGGLEENQSYSDLNSGGREGGYPHPDPDGRVRPGQVFQRPALATENSTSSTDYPLESQSESQSVQSKTKSRKQTRKTKAPAAKAKKGSKSSEAVTATGQPRKKREIKGREQSQPDDYFQENHLTLEKELGKGEDYGALGELAVGFFPIDDGSPVSNVASSSVAGRRPSVQRSGSSSLHLSKRQIVEDERFSNGPSADSSQIPTLSLNDGNDLDSYESIEPPRLQETAAGPKKNSLDNWEGDLFELQLELMNAYQSQEASNLENYGNYVPFAPVISRAYSWDARFPGQYPHSASTRMEGIEGVGQRNNRGESMPPPETQVNISSNDHLQTSNASNIEGGQGEVKQVCHNEGDQNHPTNFLSSTFTPPSMSTSTSFDDPVSLPLNEEALRFTSTFSSTSQPNIKRGHSSYNQKRLHSLPEVVSDAPEAKDPPQSEPEVKKKPSTRRKGKGRRSAKSKSSAADATMTSLEVNPSTSASLPCVEADTSVASPDDTTSASVSKFSLAPPISSTPPRWADPFSTSEGNIQFVLDPKGKSKMVKGLRSKSFLSDQVKTEVPSPVDNEDSDDEMSEGVHMNLTSGKWTRDEDDELINLVEQFGSEAMTNIASRMSTGRSIKQCKTRWIEVLDPTINREPFSKFEDRKIAELHLKFASRWADITLEFEGRPPQKLKDRWRGAVRRNLPLLRQVREKVERSQDLALESKMKEDDWKDERIDWEQEDWDSEPETEFQDKLKKALRNETKSMKNERRRLEELEADQLSQPVIWRGEMSKPINQPGAVGQKRKSLSLVSKAIFSRRRDPQGKKSAPQSESLPSGQSSTSTESDQQDSSTKDELPSAPRLQDWSSFNPKHRRPSKASKASEEKARLSRPKKSFRKYKHSKVFPLDEIDRPLDVVNDRVPSVLSRFPRSTPSSVPPFEGTESSDELSSFRSQHSLRDPFEFNYPLSAFGSSYLDSTSNHSVANFSFQQQYGHQTQQTGLEQNPEESNSFRTLPLLYEPSARTQNLEGWIASNPSPYHSRAMNESQANEDEAQSQMRAESLQQVFDSSNLSAYSPMQRCDFFSQPGAEDHFSGMMGSPSFDLGPESALDQGQKGSNVKEKKRKRVESFGGEVSKNSQQEMEMQENLRASRAPLSSPARLNHKRIQSSIFQEPDTKRRRRIGTEGGGNFNSRFTPSFAHQISSSRTDLESNFTSRSRTLTHSGITASPARAEVLNEFGNQIQVLTEEEKLKQRKEAAESLTLFASSLKKLDGRFGKVRS